MTEPARWGLRRTVLDWLDKARLARPAVRMYELVLAARTGAHHEAADELPLPPSRLRAQAGPDMLTLTTSCRAAASMLRSFGSSYPSRELHSRAPKRSSTSAAAAAAC